jgi:cytochrome c biogenesis protein
LEVFLSDTEKEKKDVFESIWKFLASVKLAIFILIILASSSIIGTIVEQGAEPAQNIQLLAKFVGDQAAPTVYNIFAKLGFMDMYGSWWFVSFLILFSINLIICSLDRLPKTWKFIQRPLKPLSDNAISAQPVKRDITLRTSLNVARDEIANILKAAKYQFDEATENDSVQFYSQKFKYARLGAYVVHISLILIFAGAVIGLRFGFKASINLPEGREANYVYLSPTERIPLGFTVKCNWYKTEYYGETTTPREFSSELVVFENGKEILTKRIEVNDPLTYKGITFYQSSYGVLSGVLEDYRVQDTPSDGRMTTLQPKFSKFPNLVGRFIITVAPANGKGTTLSLRRGEVFTIPATNVKGTVIGFSPTLDRDRRSSELGTNSYYKDQLVNPAVAIEVEAPGREKFVGWFLQGDTTIVVPEAEHTIKFDEFNGIEYTGLQVAKDPGVWLIYLACIVMSLGLYVSFFISHRKIWIKITDNKKSVRITIGGSVNRNKLNFEKEVDRLLSHASKAIEGRSKQ